MPPSPPEPGSKPKFDAYAASYLSLHQQNVAVTGEEPIYFAQYKLDCLTRLLGPTFDEPILDFGCGIGMLTSLLTGRFSEVHGYDPSEESLAVAREKAPLASFSAKAAQLPDGRFGIAVMSCVLHHIPPPERDEVMKTVLSKLRPGTGRLVVFEHNPLNPVTRWAVAQCPFDDDAVLLWPREARRLMSRNGFRQVHRRFIVFLPKALASIRFLEPYLGWLPIGAQMMLVGTRPG